MSKGDRQEYAPLSLAEAGEGAVYSDGERALPTPRLLHWAWPAGCCLLAPAVNPVLAQSSATPSCSALALSRPALERAACSRPAACRTLACTP